MERETASGLARTTLRNKEQLPDNKDVIRALCERVLEDCVLEDCVLEDCVLEDCVLGASELT